MSWIELDDEQIDAVQRMHNGCILCGKVGAGKSRVALTYYYLQNGGVLNLEHYHRMKQPRDLYIITTAKKRDDLDWDEEMIPFLISRIDVDWPKRYKHQVVVDSWNNIQKYKKVAGAFFIFDEQRVVGKGAWVKAFLNIARKNQWILLSATPGDKWEDYIPVFVANGFYKNRTEFNNEHLIYKPFSKYPQVIGYQKEGKLMWCQKQILINMDDVRHTVEHHETIWVGYDRVKYRTISVSRKDPETGMPIKNASEYCYLLRKAVNSDETRVIEVMELTMKHPKLIIFYNFDYELDILRHIQYLSGTMVAEWNGHKHEGIPKSARWVYLVQYTAGAEGWNCIETDAMLFYSQNYSYKLMEQASGRINRKNTPFTDLYYYHLKSRCGIDLAIQKALTLKQRFNERSFYGHN